MIQVRTLGESEIRIGRKRITPNTEMVFALALYLCLRAGERVTRDEVVETFWETADEEKGRHSLRQLLYRLRQRGFVLDEETEELYLDPARLDCDLAVVLSEAWPESALAADVERAGAATPLITRRIGERFQEWYEGVMDRVRRQHRRAALRQIVRARREGRWADLERWAQHVLRSDPLNEEATLARAESAAMAGSKAMALEILDQYMEELGDRASVIGLPATVLRRRIAERRPEWGTRGPREVPLVGREELMARLTGMVDAAGRGEGRAVVLWGAPGVGKTRLASETMTYAELAGFRCLRYRALLGTSAQPLAAVLSLVPLLTELPGAAGAHPSTLALLARASQHHTDLSPHDPVPHAFSLGDHIARGIHDVLESASSECRILVALDDVHNFDAASIGVLHAVIGRSRRLRAMWLSTSRVWDATSAHAGTTPTGLIEHVLVGPLARASSTRLTQSLSDHAALKLSDQESQSIVDAAGGNPFFVRELAYHAASRGPRSELPRSLRDIMRERLAIASPEQTRLLRVATILGPFSTIPRLRQLAGNESPSLAPILESLEHEGMLRLGPSLSLELHECWATAVEETISPVIRIALSHECATILVSDPGSSDAVERRWRAAELFASSGDSDQAISLYADVADQLLARGLVEQAAATYDRAASVCSPALFPGPIRVRRARALLASGRLDELLDTCRQELPQGGSRSLGTDDVAALACLELDARWKLRLDHATALQKVYEVATDPRVHVEARQLACLTGIVVAFNDISSDLEGAFYELSRSIAATHGDSNVSALVMMIFHAERGDYAGVQSAETLLKSLESEMISDSLRCRALRIRATAHRWAGDAQSRNALAERAHSLALSAGLRADAAIAAELMTFASLDDDDTDSIEHWMQRWKDALPPTPYFARAHALTHARSRILMRSGEYAEALALLKSEPSKPSTDPMGRQRATDEAAMALCLAKLGDAVESRQNAESCAKTASSLRPSAQVDFIVEHALRAFEAIGDVKRLEETRRDYLGRRREISFPIAAAFAQLHAASSGHSEDEFRAFNKRRA